MKTIFYGVAGEGLGHATRTHSLIAELQASDPNLSFHVFTFGEAHEYFKRLCLPGVELWRIDGMRFGRGKDSRISRLGTIRSYWEYRSKGLPKALKLITRAIRRHSPSVVVTDFEPSVAEAARREGVPLVSVDNQHKFSHFATDDLPISLRAYCNLTGFATERMIGPKNDCVVSTFYHRLGRSKVTNVTKTNVFIRQAVRDLKPTDDGHVLVYFKDSIGPEMISALRYCDSPVLVFGTTAQWLDRVGFPQFEFHPLDYTKFATALAGCKALFCASGNQLLGEACYFNKPTFTVPEPNQHEQSVNAHYAELMGFARRQVAGRYCQADVMEFLESFRPTPQDSEDGTSVAAGVVGRYLGG